MTFHLQQLPGQGIIRITQQGLLAFIRQITLNRHPNHVNKQTSCTGLLQGLIFTSAPHVLHPCNCYQATSLPSVPYSQPPNTLVDSKRLSCSHFVSQHFFSMCYVPATQKQIRQPYCHKVHCPVAITNSLRDNSRSYRNGSVDQESDQYP